MRSRRGRCRRGAAASGQSGAKFTGASRGRRPGAPLRRSLVESRVKIYICNPDSFYHDPSDFGRTTSSDAPRRRRRAGGVGALTLACGAAPKRWQGAERNEPPGQGLRDDGRTPKDVKRSCRPPVSRRSAAAACRAARADSQRAATTRTPAAVGGRGPPWRAGARRSTPEGDPSTRPGASDLYTRTRRFV